MPDLSVSLGVLLAVASVGVLIYFIHHVSVSIQANEIVGRVSKDLNKKILHLFPEDIDRKRPRDTHNPPDAAFLDAFNRDAQPINAEDDGYLQSIEADALIALAAEQGLVVRLERKPGNYVVAGRPIVMIAPGEQINEKLAKKIRPLFVLGNQRTADQDVEFVVNQLVEMAVRALSPSLNDPFTAIACVDHLGSALCRLAARDMPSPYCYDRENQLRLIARLDTFPEVADAAFNQIRQFARSNTAVTLRLLETITVIAGFASRAEDRATLFRHAEMIARGARQGLAETEDRKAVEECWQVASLALKSPAIG